jgi:hypothetical protein
MWGDDDFWVIGPFNYASEAADWGSTNSRKQAHSDDPFDWDPRWHVLQLADPHKPVRVISQEETGVEAIPGAYSWRPSDSDTGP